MCTLVLLRRPGHPWPLVLAANRDEMADRPWRPPGRHWPDRPGIVGGRDDLAGGSWLAINDFGVIAAVLNRHGSLGPEPGKHSRGDLVLQALDHRDASAAATWLARRHAPDYRTFNMMVADRQNAFWIRHAADEPNAESRRPAIEAFEIPAGTSMLTARERNDPASPRIRANLERFEAAKPPDPRAGRWGAWKRLLASRRFARADGREAAMNIETDSGFGTVCSALIALPGPPQSARAEPARPVWLFAAGPPDRAPFEAVEL
ncbi:MAG: NRDE family protein [Kiloniellaceae bacterium]